MLQCYCFYIVYLLIGSRLITFPALTSSRAFKKRFAFSGVLSKWLVVVHVVWTILWYPMPIFSNTIIFSCCSLVICITSNPLTGCTKSGNIFVISVFLSSFLVSVGNFGDVFIGKYNCR